MKTAPLVTSTFLLKPLPKMKEQIYFYLCAHVCLPMCEYTQRPEARVTGGYESPTVGAEFRTQVLYKSNMST